MAARKRTTRANGAKAEEERPEFDFSEYNWVEAREMARLQHEAERAVALLEEKSVLLNIDQFEAALEEERRVMDQLEEGVAHLLVSIPRDWLIASAPDEIDWSKRDSFKWLRANRFRSLQLALAEASGPERVSGN